MRNKTISMAMVFILIMPQYFPCGDVRNDSVVLSGKKFDKLSPRIMLGNLWLQHIFQPQPMRDGRIFVSRKSYDYSQQARQVGELNDGRRIFAAPEVLREEQWMREIVASYGGNMEIGVLGKADKLPNEDFLISKVFPIRKDKIILFATGKGASKEDSRFRQMLPGGPARFTVYNHKLALRFNENKHEFVLIIDQYFWNKCYDYFIHSIGRQTLPRDYAAALEQVRGEEVWLNNPLPRLENMWRIDKPRYVLLKNDSLALRFGSKNDSLASIEQITDQEWELLNDYYGLQDTSSFSRDPSEMKHKLRTLNSDSQESYIFLPWDHLPIPIGDLQEANVFYVIRKLFAAAQQNGIVAIELDGAGSIRLIVQKEKKEIILNCQNKPFRVIIRKIVDLICSKKFSFRDFLYPLISSKSSSLRFERGVIYRISKDQSEEAILVLGEMKWGVWHNYVERMTGRTLPASFDKMLDLLKKEKRIPISTDWDLLATPQMSCFMPSYLKKVYGQVPPRRDQIKSGEYYSMHYHPREPLWWEREIPPMFFEDFFYRRLNASTLDMRAARLSGIGLYSIRVLGSPGELKAQYVDCVRFYSAKAIDRDKKRLRKELVRFVKRGDGKINSNKKLIKKIFALMQEIVDSGYPLHSILADIFLDMHAWGDLKGTVYGGDLDYALIVFEKKMSDLLTIGTICDEPIIISEATQRFERLGKMLENRGKKMKIIVREFGSGLCQISKIALKVDKDFGIMQAI